MADEAAAPTANRRWATAAAALFLAAIALYVPSLDDGFLTLDDHLLIVENRVIQPPAAQLERVWEAPLFEIYMPLTYTLWAVESAHFRSPNRAGELGRLVPGPFHLVCVLLHAANAVLTLTLFRQLGAGLLAAACGALLFAVHPLQVESVYWITETKGTLSGFLGLLAVALYVRSVAWRRSEDSSARSSHDTSVSNNMPLPPHPNPLPKGEGSRRSRFVGISYYVVATICFILALLAKPSAAAIPLLALVLEVGWLRRRWRPSVLALAPWFLATAGFAWVAKGAQGDELLEFVPAWRHRPLVALDALAFYVRKVFWPADLAIDYGRTPLAVLRDIGPTLAWSAESIVVLTGLAVGWRRRRPWAVAGWVFIAALLPVSGLISFAFQTYSTVADRYAYLALLGPALALVWWLADGRRWKAVFTGLALVALAAVNLSQGAYWQTSRALYEHTLTVHPQSWLAQFKLAMLNGQEADAALSRGDRAAGERLRAAELVRYRETLQIKANLAGARANLGFLLLRLDRWSEAAEEFEILLAQRPDEPRGHTGLGIALFQLGRTEAAAAQFREVVRLRPNRRTAHLQLGLALLKLGEYADAQAALQRVISDRAEPVEAIWRLAQALQCQGSFAEAAREYRRALRNKQTAPTVAADLAWLLATHDDPQIRQPSEALQWARRACADAAALDDPVRQDILAAALAASGEFSAAESTAQRAADVAQRSNLSSLADEVRARALLYRGQEPFIQSRPLPRAAAAIDFDLGRQE